VDVGLIGEVAVWRAANGSDPHDRRPSGPAQLQTLRALWQRDLDRRMQHSDKTVDSSVHEKRAASATFKGLRPEDRHHPPPAIQDLQKAAARQAEPVARTAAKRVDLEPNAVL
jgi:hypothetical protein